MKRETVSWLFSQLSRCESILFYNMNYTWIQMVPVTMSSQSHKRTVDLERDEIWYQTLKQWQTDTNINEPFSQSRRRAHTCLKFWHWNEDTQMKFDGGEKITDCHRSIRILFPRNSLHETGLFTEAVNMFGFTRKSYRNWLVATATVHKGQKEPNFIRKNLHHFMCAPWGDECIHRINLGTFFIAIVGLFNNICSCFLLFTWHLDGCTKQTLFWYKTIWGWKCL